MTTFPKLIEDLGGYAVVAEILGLPKGTVSAMKTRGRIPSRHWQALIDSGPGRKVGLTAEELMRMAAAPTEGPPSDPSRDASAPQALPRSPPGAVSKAA